MRAGAFGYVPKPFRLVYLEHLAAAATDQSKAQASRRLA
jgi:DNA-binding NtrC family response regulator